METMFKNLPPLPLNNPVPVYQEGRRIGTVPHDFDPGRIKSQSYFYDPRPGDFAPHESGWEANKILGLGDLKAIPGFSFEGY
jgi:hypothetical protein